MSDLMKSFKKTGKQPDYGIVERNLKANCGQFRFMFPGGINLCDPTPFGMDDLGNPRIDKLKKIKDS